jgi:predicted anti-sigma-YlaC factor YlaD
MTHYDPDTLDDYLHGELDAARDATVHAHVERCALCRAAYDQAVRLRDWIRDAALAEEREFPSLIKARVWEAIAAAPASTRFAWLRSAPMRWAALPVAAAIAFAAYLGVPAIHGAPPVGVAATDLLLEHAAQMADNPLADHGIVVPASIVESSHPTSSLIEAVDASTVSDPGSDGN